MPPAPWAAKFYSEIAVGPQTRIYCLLGSLGIKGRIFGLLKDGSPNFYSEIAVTEYCCSEKRSC
jgi:hypothetical protein